MKRICTSLAALGSLLVLPPLAGAADDAAMVTVRSTDFSGRPPFTRRVETLPAAEVARLEPAPVSAETVTVRTTDYGGRPPFTRRTETLPVSEVARLEAEDAIEAGGSSLRKRAAFRSKIH
ncbi:MAG: hypothetical protein H6977_08245 [Gammaproteobacteria bacterium]|nr:hypothetical protein [Gammaproteobacteria bacterium]MCP5199989.1 hypothetical protein [Gammaproteobacteria bacterium]